MKASMIRAHSWKILLSLLMMLSMTACKVPNATPGDAGVAAVSACTVWPGHFMVTKGNIPVFESPEALDANTGAKYVGKNTPVIRELTILNEDKDATLMKIVVRGGSLAGEKRWWTLAGNLESRTKSKCPANTPRKCSENAVHFCDGSGCRCIDAGVAPDDPIGNAVIETVATLGLGSVKSLGYLMISRINAVSVLSGPAPSVATQFGDEAIDLVRHVAPERTLLQAEAYVATKHMSSFKAARKLIAEKTYYLKLDVVELSALRFYTGMGYAQINKALRTGDAALLSELRPVIEAASSGLVKLSEKAFRGTVYRGVSFTPEVAALYKPGVHITEKAFTSTTRNAGEKFAGNTLFHITSKSGRMIDEISHFSKEAEVLFAPGTVFKVLRNSVQTINGKQVNLIVMEQVVGR